MMLGFSRWTMWALVGALFLGCDSSTGPLSLPAAVGRPAEVSQGPRVGVIVVRGGEVTVVPGTGKPFPGLPEQQLLRDDKLVTAGNSFVVVQLHNGHLVRLGENQSNVVEMLAPFHDPPAGDDVEARFVRLLTPAEQGDQQLTGAITRVAGWNTRMTASESFAALPAAESPRPTPPPPIAASPAPIAEAPASIAEARTAGDSPEPTPAPRQQEGAGGGDKGRADRARGDDADDSPHKSRPKPPQKAEEAEAPSVGQLPSTDDVGNEEAKKSKASSSDGAGSAAPGAPAPAPQLPGQLKFTPTAKKSGGARQVDLPEPFKSGAAVLAKCAGAGAKISGSVLAGKVTGLLVDGKKRCQELVGKPTALEDGSFELTVKP